MTSIAANVVVFLIVAVIVFFAIRSIIKKKGGCSCGCSNCSCGCGGAKKSEESSSSK